MKRENILKKPFSQAQIDAAIAAAPEHVDDPECPYDMNDPDAFEAYWANARVTLPGEHPFQRRAKNKPNSAK